MTSLVQRPSAKRCSADRPSRPEKASAIAAARHQARGARNNRSKGRCRCSVGRVQADQHGGGIVGNGAGRRDGDAAPGLAFTRRDQLYIAGKPRHGVAYVRESMCDSSKMPSPDRLRPSTWLSYINGCAQKESTQPIRRIFSFDAWCHIIKTGREGALPLSFSARSKPAVPITEHCAETVPSHHACARLLAGLSGPATAAGHARGGRRAAVGPFQMLGDQIRAGATFAAKLKDVEIVENR